MKIKILMGNIELPKYFLTLHQPLKKFTEIRRNPQKYPIKYPKQIPQANTLQ